MTMVQLEAESRGGPLVRGNRKWLVNLDKISNVYFDIAGGIALTLNSGKELTVGRTYRDSIRQCLRNAKLEAALAAD
jgi:DNA-binding LytR/AlgR family response regulator